MPGLLLRRRIAAALALAATLGAAAPRAARANCGAEGCPLAQMGPEAAIGRFSFSLGYQFIRSDRAWNGNHAISFDEALASEGGYHHVLEQLTQTKSWQLDSRAQITDRLQLSLSVPYVDRIHRHALVHTATLEQVSQWHMTGLGDATALATFAILAPSRPEASALSLQAGVKLPTGRTNVPEVNGEQPEPPARPGSGSTDLVAGAQYRKAVALKTPGGLSAEVPLTASASYRYNGRGSEDYRSGNEWQASVGGAYPLTRGIRLLAQLNASGHARDDVGSTDAVPHSTGSVALFATPGLQAEIVPGVSAFGYYQFRLHEHTNGPQLVSPYHVSIGLGYTLR